MKVRLDVGLRAGGQDLEPGEYEVAVDEDASTISLRRDGSEVARAPALARAAKMRVADPNAQLRQVSGEPRRLLIVRTPPSTEWVLSLDELA
jgi:hypothetical protein